MLTAFPNTCLQLHRAKHYKALMSNMQKDTPPGIEEPPTTFWGSMRRVGPGLIIAAGIVGSGELIATTKTGAQAGIGLLWLIVVGCIIKVFVQIEIGRYAVTHGETTLTALNGIPGPRFRVRWIIWYWVLMMIVILGQSGGIVGGVGQAFSLAFPITGDYAHVIQSPSQAELREYCEWQVAQTGGNDQADTIRTRQKFQHLEKRLDDLGQRGTDALTAVQAVIAAEQHLEKAKKEKSKKEGSQTNIDAARQSLEAAQKRIKEPYTVDDHLWALLAGIFTAALLVRGRYRFIQTLATVLVVSFTVVTLGNVFSLQLKPRFAVSASEIIEGLSFHIPASGWGTALATFGIIGVGGSELISYPYWCLEKGYAKFTGPRTEDENWARRARGWMRVMHYDAFVSMVIYTVATLAFFVMGVTVLHRQGLDPDDVRMVGTLSEQYVPVFGEYAKWLFLVGAISVLYSTFLVGHAAFARLYTDALKVFGILDPTDQQTHESMISIFSVVTPMLAVGIYCVPNANPVALVLAGGTMQAVILPMLAFAALYFRFKKTDPRLAPRPLWNLLLILSCVGLLIAGSFSAYDRVASFFGG